MALVTIVAKNQTASPLPITQLMVAGREIPASGNVTLTEYNPVEAILRDDEILGYIQDDSVLLQINTIDLTKNQSLSFMDAPTIPVKVAYGESQPPDEYADADAGYSTGSAWITSGGDIHICVDATPGAAVWLFHKTMPHLIHFLEEGPGDGFPDGPYFKEVLPAGDLYPLSITWYTDSGKGTKVAEKLITREGGGATKLKPTPIVVKVYLPDGASGVQASDAITYVGIVEHTRARTVSTF